MTEGELEVQPQSWWQRHAVVGVASLIVLALAVSFTLYMGQRAANDLAEAQCRAATERGAALVATFTKIVDAIPGETDVERDILDFVITCNPPRNCTESLIAPSPPDECFVSTVSSTTTTTG